MVVKILGLYLTSTTHFMVVLAFGLSISHVDFPSLFMNLISLQCYRSEKVKNWATLPNGVRRTEDAPQVGSLGEGCLQKSFLATW